MCRASTPKVEQPVKKEIPPPPPPPEEPPRAPAMSEEAAERSTASSSSAAARRGTRSLRINLNVGGGQSGGAGLNIPS